MAELRFTVDWQSRGDVDPRFGETTANLGITLGELVLTQNVDIWSRTTRDQVLVSAYPLAMWIASSWWRLHHEVLPVVSGKIPPTDWRLSHEMTAANCGYVWPLLAFSTDRKSMSVWAEQFPPGAGHSVRYLTGIQEPSFISMRDFSLACGNFVESVLARLDATAQRDSDLLGLWSLIQADSSDPAELVNRRIEAQFGFDPESCPSKLLTELISIEKDKGEDVLAELATVRFWDQSQSAQSIRELFDASGIEAQPELPKLSSRSFAGEPWRQAKADADYFRAAIGAGEGLVPNSKLAELLGIDFALVESPFVKGRPPAAIAGHIDERTVRIIPRRRHPVGYRFELARIIGGYSDAVLRDGNSWIASTDSGTARQKYQRAFAAEFLCPIEPLAAFLENDFSDDAIEDAATRFQVSEKTVVAQLMNNHYLPRSATDLSPPYSMVA